MKTLPLSLVAICTLTTSSLHASGWPVVDAGALTFNQIKWSWEQAQWAEKLQTLQSTLQTTQRHLNTINAVKYAIGDPASVTGGLIDPQTFTSLVEWNGIPSTLSSIQRLLARGSYASDTIQQLYNEPIDIDRFVRSNSYTGISSFRDPKDPLKRYRAIENAYAEYENSIQQAQKKRIILNQQIARLNNQLKGAKTDAEVQKLQASLLASQSALTSLDQMEAQGGERVKMLIKLNENREKMEMAADNEITKKRNANATDEASRATRVLFNHR